MLLDFGGTPLSVAIMLVFNHYKINIGIGIISLQHGENDNVAIKYLMFY